MEATRLSGEVYLLKAGECAQGELCGRRFGRPFEVVSVSRLEDVRSALERIEAAVNSGSYAAGLISYEAGAAFDEAFPRRELRGFPYLWFGLYEEMDENWRVSPPPACDATRSDGFAPCLSRDAYTDSVGRLHALIAAGDTYQVNYTFPLTGAVEGDAFALFLRLSASQRTAAHRAYLDIGTHRILSVSPELFFALDGDRIVTRPMKGTMPRGLTWEEDVAAAKRLASSPKERAENLMIVDLLRNDLGRIAETGTVEVESLFETERYDTVWQMTSTVSARTRASVPEILAALFPSGSVTGAPKIRTMQIIDEMEPEARGVYCGAIGWWGPGRRAEFSVAIRTMVADAKSGAAAYRVGSAITWDAPAHSEYDECLLKAEVLRHSAPEFELLESLLLEDGVCFLLDEHLARLERSAEYFGFLFDAELVRAALKRCAGKAAPGRHKVRLCLSRAGGIAIDSEEIGVEDRVRAVVAKVPIDIGTPFVYHKTTHRAVYEAARVGLPEASDVILWNERGELTESTRANLVLEIDGKRFTPPVSSGLLAGTFREYLLRRGEVEERVLMPADIEAASGIWLVNSVRGWMEAEVEFLPGIGHDGARHPHAI